MKKAQDRAESCQGLIELLKHEQAVAEAEAAAALTTTTKARKKKRLGSDSEGLLLSRVFPVTPLNSEVVVLLLGHVNSTSNARRRAAVVKWLCLCFDLLDDDARRLFHKQGCYGCVFHLLHYETAMPWAARLLQRVTQPQHVTAARTAQLARLLTGASAPGAHATLLALAAVYGRLGGPRVSSQLPPLRGEQQSLAAGRLSSHTFSPAFKWAAAHRRIANASSPGLVERVLSQLAAPSSSSCSTPPPLLPFVDERSFREHLASASAATLRRLLAAEQQYRLGCWLVEQPAAVDCLLARVVELFADNDDDDDDDASAAVLAVDQLSRWWPRSARCARLSSLLLPLFGRVHCHNADVPPALVRLLRWADASQLPFAVLAGRVLTPLQLLLWTGRPRFQAQLIDSYAALLEHWAGDAPLRHDAEQQWRLHQLVRYVDGAASLLLPLCNHHPLVERAAAGFFARVASRLASLHGVPFVAPPSSRLVHLLLLSPHAATVSLLAAALANYADEHAAVKLLPPSAHPRIPAGAQPVAQLNAAIWTVCSALWKAQLADTATGLDGPVAAALRTFDNNADAAVLPRALSIYASSAFAGVAREFCLLHRSAVHLLPDDAERRPLFLRYLSARGFADLTRFLSVYIADVG